MVLSPTEEPAVRRAIEAYREVRRNTVKGAYRGVTPDQILEELHPTPARWAELAAFVIECASQDE